MVTRTAEVKQAAVGTDARLEGAEALRLYRAMVRIRTVDERMMTLQRQGRVGFYGACTGQEAAYLAVAIALGAGRPEGGVDRIGYLAGASAASLVIALMVLLAYASADRLVERLGHARARVLGRLAAFLLLCVGTQITLTGVTDVLGPLIANARPGFVR